MRQAEYDMGETRSALGVICSSYDEFFEAEKKIADYMMEHKAEVAFYGYSNPALDPCTPSGDSSNSNVPR